MTVDARAMAAECARAVEACESPTRRAVLGTLQKLWIELGEKERLLSEQEESLHDAWADTTTAHGRLMLTILGGLAEFERELILARTSDGRTRAKARGVRFGRPPSLPLHQRQEATQRLSEGATQADLARTYGASQATISRLQA